MKYLVLIYGNEALDAKMTEAERGVQLQEYNAFTEEVHSKGLMEGGEALLPTSSATTVRLREGKLLVTDGPFAETHEQLGGYYVLKCKNLDEAIEAAAKIPSAKTGSIEIRPIVEWD